MLLSKRRQFLIPGELSFSSHSCNCTLTVGGTRRFLYPTFSSSAPLFLRTFISILSLYRATAPIQYETLINEVPALGMQYANDCEWMGEEVIKVWKSFDKGKGREREEQEVSVAVSRLIQMGVQGRTKQIVSHFKRFDRIDVLTNTGLSTLVDSASCPDGNP